MKTIKTLGVATAMALALIAFAGASAASANWFQSQTESTTWSGTRAGKNHVLNLGGETFSCEKVSFSGVVGGKSVGEITTSPELSNCTWVNNQVVNWVTNGCKYRFHAGSDAALTGWIDITGCEKPMTFSMGSCKIEIGNQSNIGPVTYKNVAGSPSTVTAVASFSGITYTRGGLCGSGSPGTYSNGTYSGEWTVKGSTSGAPVGVEVKATAAPFSGFNVEEAPATLSSTSVGNLKRVSVGKLEYCNQLNMSGSSASLSSKSITLAPSYKECTVSGEAVPSITAGGCSYVLYGSGKFEVAGATCASSPIVVTQPGCVVTIGPQSGNLVEPGYQNQGWGPFRTVSLSNLSSNWAEGITYTATGAGCPAQGTFSTGKIWVAGTFSATKSGGATQGFWIE